LVAKPIPNEKPLPELPGPSKTTKQALKVAVGRLRERASRLKLRSTQDEAAENPIRDTRARRQWRGLIHVRTSTEEQRLLNSEDREMSLPGHEEPVQSPSDGESSLQNTLGRATTSREYRLGGPQDFDMSLQDALDSIEPPEEQPRPPMPPIPGYLLLGQETRAQRKERKKREGR
jgi:hypothetical protein